MCNCYLTVWCTFCRTSTFPTQPTSGRGWHPVDVRCGVNLNKILPEAQAWQHLMYSQPCDELFGICPQGGPLHHHGGRYSMVELRFKIRCLAVSDQRLSLVDDSDDFNVSHSIGLLKSVCTMWPSWRSYPIATHCIPCKYCVRMRIATQTNIGTGNTVVHGTAQLCFDGIVRLYLSFAQARQSIWYHGYHRYLHTLA